MEPLTDEQKLDLIVGETLKLMLRNKFEDENYYIELVKRLSNLANIELRQRIAVEERRQNMMAANG